MMQKDINEKEEKEKELREIMQKEIKEEEEKDAILKGLIEELNSYCGNNLEYDSAERIEAKLRTKERRALILPKRYEVIRVKVTKRREAEQVKQLIEERRRNVLPFIS